MPDDFKLTDEERAAILAEREKHKKPRKVVIHGTHEGVSYDFEVEGDEAENVIKRHAALFAPAPEPDDKKPPRPTLLPPRAKSG